MAGAATNADEQNFWPGYVDTLVNMVMFLILLIVILAMAVMYFSMRAKADASKSPVPSKETITKQAHEKTYPGVADEVPKNPTVEDMRKMVDRMQQKLQQSELRYKAGGQNQEVKPENVQIGKSEKIEEASAKVSTTPTAGVHDLAARPTSLIVRFKPGALDLSPEEAKRMSEVFVKHFDYASNKAQSFVLSSDAVEGLSESNRMAYYRVVAVRNRLMSLSGVPSSKIAQKIIAVPPNSTTGVEALEVRITRSD
ncbi:vesicle formation protein [Limnohabitans sp.]|uniref:vesicle formation protein n=1 Tax=Limnohabitans sp. TaxID=1907725 RepID=UPI00286EEE98|nr:vesicle formation protein [Limnohabitans sp.]